MVKSCYIHIPFCENICSYCDFCKMFYDEQLVDQYLDALLFEIKNRYKNEILNTIYIGGGTPSCLSYKQLKKLFSILEQLKKADDIEFSMECNFSSITKEKLELMKKFGINRLSFGVESISHKNLKVLERNEKKDQIRKIILLARKLGFHNINLDLMYAIPGETLEELEQDIDFVLSLDVEHISTYSLILEPNTKLYIQNIKSIDEDLDFFMYNRICKRLQKKYHHYEISNFSKNGYESRHNLCYWHNEEYYGFGLGASFYIDDIRYTNTRSITKYVQHDFLYQKEDVDIKNKMSYEMILGLRLLKGVSKSEFFHKYHQKIEDVFKINDLIQNNMIKEDHDYYFLNPNYIYISNEILMHFIKEYEYE